MILLRDADAANPASERSPPWNRAAERFCAEPDTQVMSHQWRRYRLRGAIGT
jgi:hypothetical protein